MWWMMVITWIICVSAVLVWSSHTVPLYTGRTTIALMTPPSEHLSKSEMQSKLSAVEDIARSTEVLQATSSALSKLGVKVSLDDLRRSLNVDHIKDTSILAIEVTFGDPEQAKVMTDVVAAEMKKRYNQLCIDHVVHSRELLQKQADRESKALDSAKAGLESTRINPSNAAAIAKLKADAEIAEKEYAKLSKQLQEALWRERLAHNESTLKTIDPAYVIIVNQHKFQKLLAAGLSGWIPGLIIAILWCRLAARKRRAKQNKHTPQEPLVPTGV